MVQRTLPLYKLTKTAAADCTRELVRARLKLTKQGLAVLVFRGLLTWQLA
jgi:hypothetical protein